MLTQKLQGPTHLIHHSKQQLIHITIRCFVAMVSLPKYSFKVEELINEKRVNEEDVMILKKWTNEQKLPKYSNETIAIFLIACNNNIDDAKKCAVEFYIGRNSCPEIFSNRNIHDPVIQKEFKTAYYALSSRRTKDNCIVLTLKFRDTNPWHYYMAESMKIINMAIDAEIYKNPPNGLIMLCTTYGGSAMHLTRLNFSLIKRAMHYINGGLNIELKAVHILDVNWLARKVVALLSPLFKPSVYASLHFHASDMDMDDFFENYLQKDCVSLDFGGTDKTLDELSEETWKNLKNKDLKNFFEQEERSRML